MNKFAMRRISTPSIIAVVLALNGFLNLATGLIGVFRIPAVLPLEGMSEYLQFAPSAHFSGLLSVFLGLLLLRLGKGIYERRRTSWAVSLFVLILLMVNNVYRGTTPYTAVLSGMLVASLLLFRRQFDVRPRSSVDFTQIIAWASVLFALAYGILGSYALRAQFSGLETWADAVYFTFVTYSTLGYGDILPDSVNARIFVISMIPIGLASFITALSALLGPMIEKRLKGVLRIMKRFQNTSHVIICGYSNAAESAADEFIKQNKSFLIVDDRQDLALHIESKGYDVILGNPTRKEILQQANIQSASALIAAFDQDSKNLLIAVTAREIRNASKGCHCVIVVRVEDEENIEKARRIGADQVVSPSTLGGRLMATRALDPSAE